MIDFTTTPCVTLTNRKNLPDTSGVYFVVNNSGDILYIGKSKNLVKRWVNHHRMPELRQQQNTLIYYCELASSEIDAVERRLIAEINPPMNGAIERAARGYRNITPLAAKYGSPGRPIESPSGKRRESVTVRIDPDLKAKALAHGLKLGPLLEEAIVAALQ